MNRVGHEVNIAWRTRAELGEGPIWDESRRVLWWVDIEQSRLHCFSPELLTSRYFTIGSKLSSVVCTTSRELLLASGGHVLRFNPETSEITSLVEVYENVATRRLNDGKCDPTGRYWVGSMSLDTPARNVGSLYSFDSAVGIRRVQRNITSSNGMAWSSDGTVMYYIDSAIGTVDAFDFDATYGALTNRRVVFDVPLESGIADGMTVDAEDKLWVAFWGGGCVARIDPKRHIVERTLKLPVSHVTSCAFGGESLHQLYITTARYGLSAADQVQQPDAGCLFVAEPGVPGLAPALFQTAGLDNSHA